MKRFLLVALSLFSIGVFSSEYVALAPISDHESRDSDDDHHSDGEIPEHIRVPVTERIGGLRLHSAKILLGEDDLISNGNGDSVLVLGCGCAIIIGGALLFGGAIAGSQCNRNSKDYHGPKNVLEYGGCIAGISILAVAAVGITCVLVACVASHSYHQMVTMPRNERTRKRINSLLTNSEQVLLSPSFQELVPDLLSRDVMLYFLTNLNVDQIMLLAQTDLVRFRELVAAQAFGSNSDETYYAQRFLQLMDKDDLELKKLMANKRVKEIFTKHPSILATIISLKKDSIEDLGPAFIAEVEAQIGFCDESMLERISESGTLYPEKAHREKEMCEAIHALKNFDELDDLGFLQTFTKFSSEEIAIVQCNIRQSELNEKFGRPTTLRAFHTATKEIPFLKEIVDGFIAANPAVRALAFDVGEEIEVEAIQ